MHTEELTTAELEARRDLICERLLIVEDAIRDRNPVVLDPDAGDEMSSAFTYTQSEADTEGPVDPYYIDELKRFLDKHDARVWVLRNKAPEEIRDRAGLERRVARGEAIKAEMASWTEQQLADGAEMARYHHGEYRDWAAAQPQGNRLDAETLGQLPEVVVYDAGLQDEAIDEYLALRREHQLISERLAELEAEAFGYRSLADYAEINNGVVLYEATPWSDADLRWALGLVASFGRDAVRRGDDETAAHYREVYRKVHKRVAFRGSWSPGLTTRTGKVSFESEPRMIEGISDQLAHAMLIAATPTTLPEPPELRPWAERRAHVVEMLERRLDHMPDYAEIDRWAEVHEQLVSWYRSGGRRTLPVEVALGRLPREAADTADRPLGQGPCRSLTQAQTEALASQAEADLLAL